MKNLWTTAYPIPWVGISIQPNVLAADALQWFIRASAATAAYVVISGALGR